MEELETKRLKFRLWRESDFEILANYFSRPEYAKYLGGVRSPEQSWRVLCTYIGNYHLKGYSYLALEEKNSNKLIGSIGIWNSDPWPEPELGYWLLPEYTGNGYITEGGMKVLEFAKQKLNLGSLVSYIDPTNEPSKKVALRLGAKYEKEIQLMDFGIHQVYRYSI